MKNDKNKQLAKNTFLFTIGSFGSKLLVFLLVPLYTNLLSTEEYGYIDLVTTTVGLVIYFFTINIADSILRFSIEKKGDENGILTVGLKIWLIGSGLFSIIVLFLYLFDTVEWPTCCYLFITLYYLFYSLNEILTNYLKGIGKLNDIVISGLLTTLITILLNIILLVVFNLGIIGYFISLVSGVLISCLFCAIRIGPGILIQWNNNITRERFKHMLLYCIPLIFNGVCWWINNSIDKYFIVSLCGASQNGIYSVSYKIPTIMTVVSSVFAQAWNLSAIQNFDRDDSDGFFSNIYKYFNLLLVITCSVLILGNKIIALVLYAKDFYIAWECSSILLISIIFSSLSGFFGSVFAATKKSKIFAVSTIISAVVNCILNLLLIPSFGIKGAAVATVCSFFLIWMIRLICTKNIIRIKINIIRDLFAYAIIVIQCVLEHNDGFIYYLQYICLILLLLLYYKELLFAIRKIYKYFTIKIKKEIKR